MMGLIYAVQGSWWPLLTVHLKDLGVSGRGVGWIFATYAMGCLVAPLGAGQLADRFLPSQRLLALIYACGTIILSLVACGPTRRTEILFALFLVYWLVTAPSYSLANSLAFRNLPRPAEQFGIVRLGGTIGWMTVGWCVSGLMVASGVTAAGEGTFEAFALAAALSACFSIYCLTLPNTPPLATARGLAWREGLDLLGRRPVAVFLGSAFGVSLTTPFVYQTVPAYLESLGLPRPWTATAMTLGQVPEIAVLGALPILLRRLGTKGTMAVGVGAWTMYYGSLAVRPPLALALAALPLNGIAIACFIVSGQVFLDSEAPPHRRASAQGLHAVVTSGIGSLVGNVLAGEVVSRQGGVGPGVFIAPCVANAVVLGVLVCAFRPGQAGLARRGVAPAALQVPPTPRRA
jgi:MFS family permease